jgi:hypothetical protein
LLRHPSRSEALKTFLDVDPEYHEEGEVLWYKK